MSTSTRVSKPLDALRGSLYELRARFVSSRLSIAEAPPHGEACDALAAKTVELGYLDALNSRGRTALIIAGSHSNEICGLHWHIVRPDRVNALDNVDVDTDSESA